MTYEKTRGREALDRLKERRRELEALRGAIILGRIDERKVELLEQEIAELEGETKQHREELDMRKSMESLETIEKVVASSGRDFAKVREQAEELYDDVVAGIMKREGCDESRAHYLAGQNEIGKRAYQAVVNMQEAERAARDGAGRIAAYVD